MNISREAGNSQSVSYSFYVINLGTGAARIYTNLLLVIITNTVHSGTLSLVYLR